MSDRDRHPLSRSGKQQRVYPEPARSSLNPSASAFEPSSIQQERLFNDTASNQVGAQVSSPSHVPGLLDRIRTLERGQEVLLGDASHLRSAHSELSQAVDEMRRVDWSINTGPFQSVEAAAFRQMLEDLKPGGVPDEFGGDVKISKGSESPVTSNEPLPLHLRTTAVKASNGTHLLPPHLRSNAANDALFTDGKVDTPPTLSRPPVEDTPPSSPTMTINHEIPRQTVEDPYVARSGQGWMPCAVLNMPKLDDEQLSTVPHAKDTATFSYDFLCNIFGGSFWSPGLKYIPPGPSVCILPNRSYYMLNAEYEPYLPREPGHHGAKLTAFFNDNPEEHYGDDAGSSFENVPLFVCSTPWATGDSRRYVYFGHYSQARWSDRLDYDRMVEHVPRAVKDYWAEELSATGRDAWVTKALKKHFFPKPEYNGRMPARRVEGSVSKASDARDEEKVLRDVKKYVGLLREWEKDAALRTKLIKKDQILKAFEAADADDPPALRLWWEYLQCTKFDRAFYDMLVTLQRREPHYL